MKTRERILLIVGLALMAVTALGVAGVASMASVMRASPFIRFVMPGLVPGIHVFVASGKSDVDGRDIQREDALRAFARP